MHTWLLEAEIALLFFAILVPLMLAPWIDRQYHRFGRLAGWPAVVSAATALYVCALVAFTMFPLPEETASFCQDRARFDYWQTQPFGSLDDVAARYEAVGLLGTLTSNVFLQVFFNVLFFVPLGLLLAHRWRRGIVATVLISFGVSLAIESTQGTGIWGIYECPYRLADVDDLITNTLGGLVGWIIGRLLNPVLPDPRPEPVADLAPPGLPRRILAAGLDIWVFILATLGITVVIDALTGSLEGESPTAIEGQVAAFGAVESLVIVLLFIVIPALRSDRATPGIASVDLVTARASAPDTGASRWSLVVRALVRFGPVPIVGPVWFAFGIVDLTCAALRRDRRTLTDLLSRTVLVTLRRFRDRVPGSPPQLADAER